MTVLRFVLSGSTSGMQEDTELSAGTTSLPAKSAWRLPILLASMLLLVTVGFSVWYACAHFFASGLKANMKGHTDSITCVAFAPDGETVATASRDRTARLWDLAKRRERAILQGHTGAVSSVAFSPDSRLVATGSEDGTVKIWNVSNGQGVTTLKGHLPSPALAVSFAPDGRTLASGGADATVRLWDVDTGKERAVLTPQTHVVLSLGFAPDSRLLATRNYDGTLSLWDLVKGKEVRRLENGDFIGNQKFCLAYAPDGKTVAINCPYRSVKLWDVSTGEVTRTLQTDRGWEVSSVLFSSDGAMVAGGTLNGDCRFWDASTGQLLSTADTGYAVSYALSPDDKTLATGGYDGVLRLWDVAKLLQKK